MAKKITLILLALVLIAPVLLGAQSPVVRLTVINQTKDTIYVQMDFPYNNLRVPFQKPPEPKKAFEEIIWPYTVFTIDRGVYQKVKIWACNGVFEGSLDLSTQVRLNFLPCEKMIQNWSPGYWGEPTHEKVRILSQPDGVQGWRFLYTYQLLPTVSTLP